MIARFTVIDEDEGPRSEPHIEGEPGSIDRHLTLRMDDVLRGPAVAGDELRIWSNEGWDVHADGRRTLTTGPGCFRLEVGDEALGALIGDGVDVARSALMTPESVLLIDGDTVAETARPEPVLQELEGRPVASVIDELEPALEQ